MISRLVAVLAVLMLAVTACSESNPLAGDPVADDRPAYANQEGPDGAEKFAGYWVDMINKASTTGQTEQLKSLGLKSCDTCADFAEHLDKVYDAGGRVETEDWTIESVIPEAGATDERVGMLVTVNVPPNKVYASEDAKPQKYQGGNQRFRMIVLRKNDHWMIQDLSPR